MISFNGDGTGCTHATDPVQSECRSSTPGSGQSADYTFAVKALNISGGSKVAMRVGPKGVVAIAEVARLDRNDQTLEIDTAGTPAAGDYVIAVDREGREGAASWSTTTEPAALPDRRGRPRRLRDLDRPREAARAQEEI